jgi:hypothetical protein
MTNRFINQEAAKEESSEPSSPFTVSPLTPPAEFLSQSHEIKSQMPFHNASIVASPASRASIVASPASMASIIALTSEEKSSLHWHKSSTGKWLSCDVSNCAALQATKTKMM